MDLLKTFVGKVDDALGSSKDSTSKGKTITAAVFAFVGVALLMWGLDIPSVFGPTMSPLVTHLVAGVLVALVVSVMMYPLDDDKEWGLLIMVLAVFVVSAGLAAFKVMNPRDKSNYMTF